MKHVIGYHEPPSGAFKFTMEPFPALKSRLVYGKYKQAIGVVPVFGFEGQIEFLPRDNFQIRYNEKEYYIVREFDTSPRCLFSAGIESSGKGGVYLVPRAEHGTDALILSLVQAGNKQRRGISALVLMDIGHRLVFKKWSPTRYHCWEWDGAYIQYRVLTPREWQIFIDPPNHKAGEVI